MATVTSRGTAGFGALLFLFFAALAAPAHAAPAPVSDTPDKPALERGVVREEIPVWTMPAAPDKHLARRPHRADPPLEEVVVFSDSLEGHPLDDEGGWTHQDLSGQTSAWHIDSLFTCQGKGWWCGMVDSSWVNDSNRAGYANSWTQPLENSVRLDTIPAGTVAKIGFKHYLNVEPGYDFGRLEVLDLEDGYITLATFTGKIPTHGNACGDTFTVSIPDTIRAKYYTDPQNPLPVYFRFVFESDVGFSSADGLYNGDGWVIDNITVSAGSQIRFFDNCEGGPKNWNYTNNPPVGDFFALQNNVTTEDICTVNRSNVWVDWDPVVLSLVADLDNVLNTPAVAVQRSDRVVVNFDVYRNLPLYACFYYHINYRWRNAGEPWSQWTDPTRLLYYGATKDWARQKIVLASAAGKDSVQVQLGVKDYGRIYCGGPQSSNGVYTFFDNVAIGVTATSPPILIQRDLDLFQDTFNTTAFWKDDNVNTPLGDSAVVQVSAPRGYKNGFLNYRVNGGSFSAVPLVVQTPALPTLRSADVLPGNYPAGTTIEYYFSVTDSTNTTRMLPETALADNKFFSMSVLPIKSAINPALACFDSLAPILFINDFAGREPKTYIADAMKGLGYKFDEWDVNGPSSLVGNTPAGSSPTTDYDWPPTDVSKLLQYKVIIWHSGNLSAQPIRKEDQAQIQSWIQQPGSDRNLWITGDDVANALWSGDEFNSFMGFTCGVRFIRDLWENFPQDTLRPIVTGQPGTPAAARLMHANADCPLIDDFDLIASSNSAILGGKAGLLLRYPNQLGAATRYATKYVSFGTDSARCAFMGFSFNDIEEGGERYQLTTNILKDYFKVNACYLATGVEDDPVPPGVPAVPNRLFQNAPNPFNPETTIKYSVGTSGPVTIRIFNAAGALVRTLVDQPHTPGAYTVRWNGQDDAGRRLGSGVYFYEIQAAGFHDSRKLVLLK